MGYREKYDEWLTSTYFDADTKAELKEIESNEKEIEDRFYHGTKILAEEDGDKKASYIALITLTKEVLETCIDLLGFKAPDRM